ncbi:MAG: hypothetical protein GXP42_05305 [Chloroflexi bacterium]|nr:hypothetical protein [Chloroflexota bacterium]
MTASTLYEALTTFDTRPLRSQSDMNRYYVEHTPRLLRRLATIMRAKYPYKVLFTGRRITGKTTALNRLTQKLQKSFFIVHLAIPKILNTFDVDYTDFMLALGTRLFQDATDEKHFPKGIESFIRDDLLGDILQWLEERVNRMNYVIGEVVRKSEKHVLFIVEDIDKLDIEPARHLFLGHARTLTSPRASIIYNISKCITIFDGLSPNQEQF